MEDNNRNSGEPGVVGHARPGWLVPLVAAVLVVVLAVAGVAGWNVYRSHVLAEAKSSCAKAADGVRGAANDYNTLLNGPDADAASIKAAQVKDAKTLSALSKAVGATAPEYAGCVADDAKGLDAATATLVKQASWYEQHSRSLRSAVDAVAASKLDRTVDDANNLLKSSEGKVADNKTRETLSKAIKARDETGIAAASKTVNDSINAKSKADAAAKAKAEEEARAAADAQAQADAAAQAQSQQALTPSTGSGGWAGGGSTPSYGSGAGSGGGAVDNWNGATCGDSCDFTTPTTGTCPESVCGV
jgi:colicin import membrane protein